MDRIGEYEDPIVAFGAQFNTDFVQFSGSACASILRPFRSSRTKEYLDCIRRPRSCTDAGQELWLGTAPLCKHTEHCWDAIWTLTEPAILRLDYGSLCPKKCGFCFAQELMLGLRAAVNETTSVRFVRRAPCERFSLRPLASPSECEAAALAMGLTLPGPAGTLRAIGKAIVPACAWNAPSGGLVWGSGAERTNPSYGRYRRDAATFVDSYEEAFRICAGPHAVVELVGDAAMSDPVAAAPLPTPAPPEEQQMERWTWTIVSLVAITLALCRSHRRIRRRARLLRAVAAKPLRWVRDALLVPAPLPESQAELAENALVLKKLRYIRQRCAETLACAILVFHFAQMAELSDNPSIGCHEDNIVILQSVYMTGLVAACVYLCVDARVYPRLAELALMALLVAEYVVHAVQTAVSGEVLMTAPGKIHIRTSMLHLFCGVCVPPEVTMFCSVAYATAMFLSFRLQAPLKGGVALIKKMGWVYNCMGSYETATYEFALALNRASSNGKDSAPDYGEWLDARFVALREFGLAVSISLLLIGIRSLLVRDIRRMLQVDQLEKFCDALAGAFAQYCEVSVRINDDLLIKQPSQTLVDFVHDGHGAAEGVVGKCLSDYMAEGSAERLRLALETTALGVSTPAAVELVNEVETKTWCEVVSATFEDASGVRTHILGMTPMRGDWQRGRGDSPASSSRLAPSLPSRATLASRKDGSGPLAVALNDTPKFALLASTMEVTSYNDALETLIGGAPSHLDDFAGPKMRPWFDSWLGRQMSLIQRGMAHTPFATQFGSVLLRRVKGQEEASLLVMFRVGFPDVRSFGGRVDASYNLLLEVLQFSHLNGSGSAVWEFTLQSPPSGVGSARKRTPSPHSPGASNASGAADDRSRRSSAQALEPAATVFGAAGG